jgi:hypothetical protein
MNEVLIKEFDDLVEKILDDKFDDEKITMYQVYDIATKLQYNRLYASANIVSTGLDCIPSALEKIAMELTNLAESRAEF